MRVIFLDIDGVLNRIGTLQENRTVGTWEGFIGMEPDLVERFNKLVEETGAEVVLSSTWRLHTDWRNTMIGNGLTCRFIDRTPRHTGYPRGREIHAWLKNNRDVTQYAIIDDDNDMLALQKSHFFQTNYREGLTEEIANAIKEYFVHSPVLSLSKIQE